MGEIIMKDVITKVISDGIKYDDLISRRLRS
jgi:predicted RNA-binding protein